MLVKFSHIGSYFPHRQRKSNLTWSVSCKACFVVQNEEKNVYSCQQNVTYREILIEKEPNAKHRFCNKFLQTGPFKSCRKTNVELYSNCMAFKVKLDCESYEKEIICNLNTVSFHITSVQKVFFLVHLLLCHMISHLYMMWFGRSLAIRLNILST